MVYLACKNYPNLSLFNTYYIHVFIYIIDNYQKLTDLTLAITAIKNKRKLLFQSTIINTSKNKKNMIINWSNGITANIVKYELEDGRIKYDIEEDNLKNEIIYDTNGEIFLNGSKVQYNSSRKDISIKQMLTYHTSDPMVGTASDYSVYDSVIESNVVADGAIAGLGFTVFCALLGGIPYLAFTITSTSILNAIYNIYVGLNIQEEKIYYKTTIMKYEDNGPHTYAFQYSTQFTNQARTINYTSPVVEYYTYII